MKVKSLLHSLFLVFLLYSCNSAKHRKHLFILSGQSNMVRMNESKTFITVLENEFGKDNIIVVKDALGSQSIQRWYKNWKSPRGEVPEQRGDLYDRLMQKVTNSITNQKIATVTFIWMQVERDARMQWSDIYEESLLGLYDQLSEDLKRDDINFIIGRLNDFDMNNEKWPDWTKIRAIQVKVGESNALFSWVNTDDLNDGLNSEGKIIYNDLHMSEKGYDTLGLRFAKNAIRLITENN